MYIYNVEVIILKVLKEKKRKRTNQLSKMAAYNRKRNKGMSWFSSLNPDAGDVEKSVDFFNDAQPSGFTADGGSSVGENYTKRTKKSCK